MNFRIKTLLTSLILFININVFAKNNLPGSSLHSTAITLNITVVNETCENFNAKIIVNAGGGVLPYTYELVNTFFAVTETGVIYLVTAGTYTVKVTDAVGTIATQVVTVTNTNLRPTITVVDKISPTDCTSANGSLKIIAAGGVPPYMYGLDEINFQTSNIFTNIIAGEYTYHVKDANGCVGVYQEDSQQTQSYLPQSTNCPINPVRVILGFSCDIFYVQISIDNDEQYTYSLDGINYQDSRFFNYVSPAGLYTTWIKNRVTGVILKYAVTLHNYCPYAFNITFTTLPYSCTQAGSFIVNFASGTAPFKYSIDAVNFQTSNQFTGLQAGTYTVTVKDAEGFLVSRSVQIINTCLQVQASSTSGTCGNNNGSIEKVFTIFIMHYFFCWV